MEKRLKAIESCLVITVGFLVLFLWLKNPWMLRIALLTGIAGAFFPWLASLIHEGWTLLARGLGWFNSRVLLSVVFFVILTPIAWVARKAKAADLQLKKKPDGASYYIERDHNYAAGDLENTW